MTPARADAGLTLLELLVVAAILGLLGAVAAGGLRFGLTAWERAGGVAEGTVETRVVQKVLARAVAGARAVRVRDGTRTPPVAFEGGPESLSFIAPMPAAAAPPGDHLIELARAQRQGADALVLRWVAVGDRRPEIGPGAAEEVLAEPIARLAFRYLGPDPLTGETVWAESWSGRPSLPALVEIGVVFAEGSGRRWPPLVIRPAAEPRP